MRANWQVSHQCWLSTALACLPRGGDSGWGAAMCFTSGLNRILQKLFQTLGRLHLSALKTRRPEEGSWRLRLQVRRTE